MTLTKLQQHLARASYQRIEFPVLSHSLSQGHDSVAHTAYRTPGADIETTGLRARRGSLRVALAGGIKGYEQQFPTLYARLKKAFTDDPTGLLVHPTEGLLEVHIDQWDEEFAPTTTDGPASFSFQWTENGTPAGNFYEADDSPSPPSALSGPLNDQAAACDDALKRAVPIVSRRPTLLAPVYDAQTEYLESGSRTLLAAEAAIREMIVATTGALANTYIAPSTGFEARALLNDLLAQTLEYRASYLATQQVRSYTTQADMTLSQVAALPAVFGDARKAKQLLDANRISNVFKVPAGTIITIVDL